MLASILVLARRQAGRKAIPGSGNIVSIHKILEGFCRVNVGNAFHVELVRSSQHGVRLYADDNIIDMVEIEKEGDTLRIGLETGDYQEVTLKAQINLPDLRGIMLNGACQGSLQGFSSANDLSISLAGASSINGEVDCRLIDLRLTGASKIQLSGSADNLMVRGLGSSIVDLKNLPVNRVTVELGGSSSATLNVKSLMEHVALSGASVLYYVGNPEFGDLTTSEASHLEHC